MKLLTQEQYDCLHPRTIGDLLDNLTFRMSVMRELERRGLIKMVDVSCSNCGGKHPSIEHTDMDKLAMRAFRIMQSLGFA